MTNAYTLTNANGTRAFETFAAARAAAQKDYGTYEIRDAAGTLIDAQW
jgi:hypothetical protein